MTSNQNKVLLFLGSGISYDSDMPSVDELTDLTFNIKHDELKDFHPLARITIDGSETIKSTQQFLSHIREYAVSQGLENINYEDLYSLCEKITQYQYSPRKDPTMRALVDFVRGQITDSNYFEQNNQSIQQCAQSASRFIEQIVKWELSIPERAPVNLGRILEYIELVGAGNIDIVTLNHDTLVEQLLLQNLPQTAWTDGFEDDEELLEEADLQEKARISYLDKHSFRDTSKVRVIKPHGSCNWFEFERKGRRELGIPRQGFSDLLQDKEGNLIDENPFGPGILTGSFTKDQAYLFRHTGYMFRHAYRIIHEYDRIICSGYGWKDFGINKLFNEWAHQDHQRKMLVMENQESSNFNTVDKLSSQWLANHQTDTRILHPQWLKETAPGEALELLNINPRINHIAY